MAKHKTADEKLHSYRSDKKGLPRVVLRTVNQPVRPLKATGSNNQFR